MSGRLDPYAFGVDLDSMLPKDLFAPATNAARVGTVWTTVTDEDWTCVACGAEKVFASRMSCFRCGAARPSARWRDHDDRRCDERQEDSKRRRRDDDDRQRYDDDRRRYGDDRRRYDDDRRERYDDNGHRTNMGQRFRRPSPTKSDPLTFDRLPCDAKGKQTAYGQARPGGSMYASGRTGPGFIPPRKPPPVAKNRVPYAQRSFEAQRKAKEEREGRRQ